MCGRYLFYPDKNFTSRYSLLSSNLDFKSITSFTPGSPGIIITRPERQNQLDYATWGLIPSWAKDPKIGFKLFNARSETVVQKPSFRGSFRYHRCLVPVSAFYEWQSSPNGQKTPFIFSLKTGQNFSLAGLFDYWHDPSGSIIQTYTIITTQPNSIIAPIHPRMPVILSPQSEDLYLNPSSSAADILSLLKPYPSTELVIEKIK